VTYRSIVVLLLGLAAGLWMLLSPSTFRGALLWWLTRVWHVTPNREWFDCHRYMTIRALGAIILVAVIAFSIIAALAMYG
jgi:hypothetical protein